MSARKTRFVLCLSVTAIFPYGKSGRILTLSCQCLGAGYDLGFYCSLYTCFHELIVCSFGMWWDMVATHYLRHFTIIDVASVVAESQV